MEVDGVFLDVRFYRKEIVIDEGRDFTVDIGFGLQPNTRASSRSGAEVEQQGLLVSLCLSECRINVFVPLNSHFQSLLATKSHAIGLLLSITRLKPPKTALHTRVIRCTALLDSGSDRTDYCSLQSNRYISSIRFTISPRLAALRFVRTITKLLFRESPDNG
jgi:hypothetical protein